MRDQSKIFIPLRSNAGWFHTAHHRSHLERLVKTYLLIYDFILLENGRTFVSVGEKGQGLETTWPGNTYPSDRSQIKFFEPGTQFGLRVGNINVLEDVTHKAYEVDFLPIIREAGLESKEYVEWFDGEIKDSMAKNTITDRVSSDLRSGIFDEVLPANRFLQEQILKGFYRDSLVGYYLDLPIAVDYHVVPLLEHQGGKTNVHYQADLPVKVFRQFMKLDLPDLTDLPWEEIVKLRESSMGHSFRRMLASVSERIKQAISEVGNVQDIDDLVRKEVSNELLQELRQRIRSNKKLIISSCLNLIPYGFLGSVCNDVVEFLRNRNSWVSIIRRK